jgi:hypothetical protein
MQPDSAIFIAYNAAWISFKGDGQLDPVQTFSTIVLFTPPGVYSANEIATDGVDFFALDPTVPSRYDSFGHQVLGIYLGPVGSNGENAYALAVHTTLSDEKAAVYKVLPLRFTATARHPQLVKIIYTQYAQGNWTLKLESAGSDTLVLTSGEYGTTWNTAEGLDAVRYFTSQGGANPGGPLAWQTMQVR